MSIDSYVEAKFYATYDKNVIGQILKRGDKLNFIYLDYVPFERYENSPHLDADAATKKIFEAYTFRHEDGPTIYIQLLKDSYIFLFIDKESESTVKISLGPFNYCWRKHFVSGDYGVDLNQCLRILLELVRPFCIKSVRTYEQ